MSRDRAAIGIDDVSMRVHCLPPDPWQHRGQAAGRSADRLAGDPAIVFVSLRRYANQQS